MFFRRERPREIRFDQRLDELRKSGFTVTATANGSRTVARDGCAAVIENDGGVPRVAERAGIVMAGRIGKLVDGGFQKFFLAPGGQKKPALASELKAVHAFQEDLC